MNWNATFSVYIVINWNATFSVYIPIGSDELKCSILNSHAKTELNVVAIKPHKEKWKLNVAINNQNFKTKKIKNWILH